MAILTNMTDRESVYLSKKMSMDEQDLLELVNRSKTEPFLTISEVIKDDVSPNVVNIDGILLPVFNKENVQSGNLVPVKSTVNNLRSLALAVASGKKTGNRGFLLFFLSSNNAYGSGRSGRQSQSSTD